MSVETVHSSVQFEKPSENTGFSDVLTPKIPQEKKEREASVAQPDQGAESHEFIVDFYRDDAQRQAAQHKRIKDILLVQAKRDEQAVHQEYLNGHANPQGSTHGTAQGSTRPNNSKAR